MASQPKAIPASTQAGSVSSLEVEKIVKKILDQPKHKPQADHAKEAHENIERQNLTNQKIRE